MILMPLLLKGRATCLSARLSNPLPQTRLGRIVNHAARLAGCRRGRRLNVIPSSTRFAATDGTVSVLIWVWR